MDDEEEEAVRKQKQNPTPAFAFKPPKTTVYGGGNNEDAFNKHSSILPGHRRTATSYAQTRSKNHAIL